MDIARVAMNSSQSNLMTQVSTRILDMTLETVTDTGEQFAAMLSQVPGQQAPTGVMNSSHIDMMV